LSERHPKKDLNPVIGIALDRGWRLEKAKGKGHIWGKLLCPNSDRTGCIIYINSTPRNVPNHAKVILRELDKCDCGKTK